MIFAIFHIVRPTRRERETYVGETYVEKPYIFDSVRVELLRPTRIHVENAQRAERETASKEGKPIVTIVAASRACRREERNWIFAIGTAGTIIQTCFSPSDQGGRGKRGEVKVARRCSSLDVAFCPSPNPTHATYIALFYAHKTTDDTTYRSSLSALRLRADSIIRFVRSEVLIQPLCLSFRAGSLFHDSSSISSKTYLREYRRP